MEYTLEIKFINENINIYGNLTDTDSNSGFDIYTPDEHIIPAHTMSYCIPLGICVRMTKMLDEQIIPQACALYPRSSTGSKTPIRLANSVGIIDKTYTGEVKAFIDNNSDKEYHIQKSDRLFQICRGDLECFNIKIVENFPQTKRNENGFGSSGK